MSLNAKHSISKELVFQQATETLLLWNGYSYVTPADTQVRLDTINLEHLIEIMECLKIWENKGENMTRGELIIANFNLGCIVEAWFRFFLCVFYHDYESNPIVSKYSKNNDKKILDPIDKLTFSMMIENVPHYLFDNLERSGETIDLWITNLKEIEKKRNAVHLFKHKEDVGNFNSFKNNCDFLAIVINKILERLPSIENLIYD